MSCGELFAKSPMLIVGTGMVFFSIPGTVLDDPERQDLRTILELLFSKIDSLVWTLAELI